MVNLTESALQQVRRLRRKQQDETLLLRLGVKNAGCSGLSYDMKLEPAAKPDDLVFAQDDVNVAIAPDSLPHLTGLELDYSSDLMGGGFRFRNPNATHTCGCGSSFATATAGAPTPAA